MTLSQIWTKGGVPSITYPKYSFYLSENYRISSNHTLFFEV